MKTRLAVLLLMSAASAFGVYTYDFADPWLYYLGTGTFTANGTGPAGGAGSQILIPSVSGNANDYEVYTQLSIQAGSGTLIHFLRASSNALAASGSCTGSYVSVELTVPLTYTGGVAAATLAINRCSAGTQSSLGGVSLGVSNNAILRSVVYGTTLLVYLNNNLVISQTVPATTGQPGVGGYGTAGGVGFPYNPTTGDSMIEIGHHDTVAPNTVSATGLRTSIFPTKASLQWQGATDDTNGIGVWGYTIARNGTTIGNVDGAEFADSTVSASTTYTYSISAIDFHGNVGSATTFSVTTPPATAVDPRRTGVASTGSYWGGGGEQIDMLGGNLNFSLPLVSPQGRPGWTVPVGLSYNSQNWRQDSGTNWELGTDVGYGYGWSLQIGSITPFYLGTGSGVDHYVFTDGTGATYLLNQNSGSIRSSSQGIYVWFDASANMLHFKNGMFWYMGSTSGGAEQDAGTMYPTVIEDAGGNQVIVTYNGAPSLPAGELNTSGRISGIQDVRSGNWGAYAFTYNTSTPVPHLTSISSHVNTPESYTFTYTAGAGLMPPYGYDATYSGQTTTQLSAISVPVAGSYGFTYDSAGASELLEAQFPWGGHLRWTYDTATYAGSRLLREVNDRYMYSAATTGGTEYGPYPITHSDSGVGGGIPIVHADATIVDASGVGAKKWTFNNSSGTAWQIGLVSQFTQLTSASGTAITQDTYTWSQTPTSLNPYISTKVSVKDPGASYAASAQTNQTQDQYGNTTQTVVYPYNNTTTPLATYNSTFVTTSGYISNYVRGLLASASVTVGTTTTTLVTNTYDGCTVGPSGVTAPAYEFDAAATSGYRGYLTSSTTPAGTSSECFYWYGVPYSSTPIGGTTTVLSVSSATNNAAPDTVTIPATLSTPTFTNTMAYDSWIALTSATAPNGATLSMTYDSLGRPATATSPYGAVTYYGYSAAGVVPAYQTTTGPNGFSQTTLDGFGRPVLAQSGTSSTSILSQTSTVYAPCACSPLGKIQATSQPYAPGATEYWTSYAYDGIGRTLTTVMPDGASTSTYSYAGNTTTVTDPAGKWKTFTSDVSGNLTTVLEPNPAGGTLTTSYTYDWMNHLVGSSMARGTTTQTRTFVYNTAGQLTSATNPESGTVAYTYNTDTTLNTKTDAKGQVTVYTYDPLKRITETQIYPYGLSYAEDVCQRVTYAYDAGTNGTGHLTSTWYGASYGGFGTPIYACPGTANGYAYQDSYTYDPVGAVTNKTLTLYTWVTSYGGWSTNASLGIGYTYDTAGRLSTATYPQTSTYGAPAPTYTYGYDGMGRPVSMADNVISSYTGVGNQWVQNGQYDAAGHVTSLKLYDSTWPGSAPLWSDYRTEATTYNVNGQLTSSNWQYTSYPGFQVLNLQYNYSATQNNAQITQMVDGISGETVTYSYDALRRLTSASSTPVSGSVPTAWTQTYGYDGFGNMTSKTLNGGANSAPAVDPTTNRLTSGYDLNGNMLTGYGLTMTYDERNRVASASQMGGTEYYGYAPDNKRIYRWNAAAGTEEWAFYGARGERLGTFALNTSGAYYFSGTQENIWFGSKPITKVVSYGGAGAQMVVRDRLGTDRETGARYYPYGDEISSTANGTEKYGTYVRDSFTTLDYADQRYYASSYGRFNTADSLASSAMARDPVSWNRYSYTGGDPVNRNDRRGTCWTDADGDWSSDGDYWETPDGIYGLPIDFSTSSYYAGLCQEDPAYVPPPLPVGQPPTAPDPPQPTCEIGLFYRKAFSKRLPWNHSYLDATCTYADGETLSETIQADPGPKPVVGTGPTAPGGYLGPPYLVGVVTSPYAGPGGSGPGPNNFQVGSWDPISYLTLLNIQAAVLNYDYNFVQPYTLFPYSKTTYNSNSFVSTLNVNFGLGFGPPPGSSPGWNNLIPGLGP